MAELILPGNRSQYLLEIDQMHERRYALFFDKLGWDPDVCGVTRGYDSDAFDMDHTVYIIERLPGSGDVVGFARLNPTTGPHMMRDLFPHFCDYQDVPVGPHIHELSRLGYFTPALKGNRRLFKYIRARMLNAISEYCLEVGIRQLSYVVHDTVFTDIQRSTWGAQPLGNFQRDEALDCTYAAGLSTLCPETNQDGLARVRAMLDDPDERVLMYHGPVAASGLPAIREAA